MEPGPGEPPLSAEAIAALATARDAAAARPGGSMNWADLLLALLEPGTAASRVVEMLGPAAEHLRGGAEFLAGHQGDSPRPDIESPTIAHAREEALTLGHVEVGTDHLLLGLADPPSGMVSAMLASVGLARDTGREAVRAARGELPGWQPPEPAGDNWRFDFGPQPAGNDLDLPLPDPAPGRGVVEPRCPGQPS